MKIIKYLFFLILIVIIGGAIYFATKDGSFNITESKVVNAPAEVIYNKVKDFKSWQEWGPWMEEDADIEVTYAEKTEGEGASYSWTSNKMGDGSMKTVKVIPNKEIDQVITFNTPVGDSDSEVTWRFEPTEVPGQTKVSWGMKGEQSLMEKVFMAFQDEDMETGIRQMYEKGLNNLDSVVMTEMKKFEISVDGITQYSGGFYMYNTSAARQSDIGTKMPPMMGQVMGFMQQNNIPMSGKPFTIYNSVDQTNGTVIFSTAVPVKDRVITPQGSPVLSGYMEEGVALKTTLKGNYDNIPAAYTKAQEYAIANNLQIDPNTPMFEVYVTNPDEVANPADYITEIYMPVISPVNEQEL
ncbi:SRPBCC family protein [Cochleicola gelatinilyticus]|uniref:AraC family transcriptional regulator n=1 Tax=Cochleicola gelatinilyticus TaxID=1763537 RepID=A0A167ER74_9FLAO|nr:SRPBCC family protein [Cochleicola gelatinilyticus]OAB75795.1 AraC family transcriptional regulator [Cochleicola gelatinilyticus]